MRQRRYRHRRRQQLDRSNVSDARFFRIVAGSERDTQKPFLPAYAENMTLFIGETFDSIRSKRVRNKRRGGTVSCGGTARGLVAHSKNHSRSLPLTFLHFVQPRGDDVCAHRPRREEYNLDAAARCSRRWHSTDRFCLPTRSFAPFAVPRIEGSFFGVTDSRHIRGSRARAPPAEGASRFCTCRDEISARSKVHRWPTLMFSDGILRSSY